MNLFPQLEPGALNSRIFKILKVVVVFAGLFLAANLLFPTAVSIILNVLWIILLFLVILFFALGVLTVIGMRKEVSQILDVLLEGSLSIIDFLHFLREVWKRFVELLQEFMVYAASIFAYLLCTIVYILLLLLYKAVGTTYDVTLLSVILTVALVAGFGILNKPAAVVVEVNNWKSRFKRNFKQGFVDGAEIILFVFFLTMDSTNLFFIPEELNVLLRAKIGTHDLMVRSIETSVDFRFTLNLIILAISTEVFRNIMRIIAMARFYYRQEVAINTEDRLVEILKKSIRKSFGDQKDDSIRLITFTTVLFFVFMFFPKLKLLTLALASATNLILDFFIRERLTHKKGTDLISRTLGFLFKV
jgi:hypothetical protein